MKTKLIVAGIAVLFGVLTSQAQAQWGDLTATFILDGKAPESKTQAVTTKIMKFVARRFLTIRWLSTRPTVASPM